MFVLKKKLHFGQLHVRALVADRRPCLGYVALTRYN